MAYTKQVWNCGDTITADKMNHIEEGIENASQGGGGVEPLIVKAVSLETKTVGGNTYKIITTDTTFQQIADAIANGRPSYLGFTPVATSSVCAATDVNEAIVVAMMPIMTVDEHRGRVYLVGGGSGGFELLSDAPDGNIYITVSCTSIT